MADLGDIQEHMSVFAADGVYLGTVDHIEDAGGHWYVRLTDTTGRDFGDGMIDGDLIESVVGDTVHLNIATDNEPMTHLTH